jgi:hypothetical protein
MQMVETVYEQVLILEELMRQQSALPQAPLDNEAADKIEKW